MIACMFVIGSVRVLQHQPPVARNTEWDSQALTAGCAASRVDCLRGGATRAKLEQVLPKLAARVSRCNEAAA
jgi:hypothetical protein